MGIAKTTNSGALLSAFSASLKGSKEGEPVLQLERGASSEAVLVVQGYGRRKSVRLPVSPLQFPSRRLLTEGKLAGRLLLSPHLPESLAADLRAAGISHADLNGRLFIKSPALLIDRAPREKKHRGLSAGVEVFTGKTSRLTRAMLATRAKSWTQEELAARTGLSRGLVSRALSWLVENDYVDTATTRHREATRYTVRASQPLLDAWVRKDNWVGRCEIYEYSVLSDDYLRNAERLQEAVGGAGLCFTQWIAA
jgi:DNA-binding transcriptional ArsR family regulator